MLGMAGKGMVELLRGRRGFLPAVYPKARHSGLPSRASIAPGAASRVPILPRCSASASCRASAAANIAPDLSGDPLECADGAGSDEKFVWEQNWYPVGLVQDFDPRIPAAVTILGHPMVVWFDPSSAQWRIFRDLCPHRLAPLSEGRIHESGGLQCSYHGWTFRGEDGSCSLIPQAPRDGPSVNESPRACARPYPVREHQGVLWVWPQPASPAVQEAAAAAPIPTVPELDDPEYKWNRGHAELNYGYEMLTENLLDPAHVPFAHHNVNNQGNRNKAVPLNFEIASLSAAGIVGSGAFFASKTFEPPCTITGRVASFRSNEQPGGVPGQTGQKPRGVLFFMCIPCSPGRSRVIFSFGFRRPPAVPRLIPRWFIHIGQMLVLDSDHLMLHVAEKRLEEEGLETMPLQAYYTPTKSDAFVCAFRSWLSRYAGSRVEYPSWVSPRLPDTPPKRILLDRQLGHVRFCRSCQRAQKGFEALVVICQVLAWALLGATLLRAVAMPGSVTAAAAAVGVALSAGFAGASLLLSRFVSRTYFFHDYIHALIE